MPVFYIFRLKTSLLQFLAVPKRLRDDGSWQPHEVDLDEEEG